MSKLLEHQSSFVITGDGVVARTLAGALTSLTDDIATVKITGRMYEHDLLAEVDALKLLSSISKLARLPMPEVTHNTLHLPGHIDEFYERVETNDRTMSWRDDGDAHSIWTIARGEVGGEDGKLVGQVFYVPDTLPSPTDFIDFKRRALS